MSSLGYKETLIGWLWAATCGQSPSSSKLTRLAHLILLSVRIASASRRMRAVAPSSRAVIPWFSGAGVGIPADPPGSSGCFNPLDHY